MQKATYTQAADSSRGVKHGRGDRLSNATTRFSAHIERWHEYAKHSAHIFIIEKTHPVSLYVCRPLKNLLAPGTGCLPLPPLLLLGSPLKAVRGAQKATLTWLPSWDHSQAPLTAHDGGVEKWAGYTLPSFCEKHLSIWAMDHIYTNLLGQSGDWLCYSDPALGHTEISFHWDEPTV